MVVHSMPTKKQLGVAELFGTWPSLTGQNEMDRVLRSAAIALWPYARFCAWSYLYDENHAYDLMDESLANVSAYLLRHRPPPTEAKVYARLRSVLTRLVKQEARNRRELLVGGLFDLEQHAAASGLVGAHEIENEVLVQEILPRLSPSAQRIAGLVAMGYSWREIGRQLRIDHQTVHRSFLREVNFALKSAKKSDRTD
jgi:DNA-binding NarL/FixJ family response regulator